MDEQLVLYQIMSKANSINYDGVFSDELDIFLSNIAKTICNCKEFLLPSLLTGVAHLMNYSKINVLNNFEKAMSIFSVLIANPSTGKSPAIEKIKNALEAVELFDGIREENSSLVNAATVEALIAYLDQFKSIVSFWDEGQTFFGSFGLYKGSSNSSYDRSHFLDLWNTPNRYRRDLKQARTVISKPRLSISLASHPYMINNLVKSEKSCKDDGLIQRFLLFAPRPVYLKNINEIEEARTSCSLEVLFYLIKLRHLNSIEYRLDGDAKEFFGQLFSKNQTHNENFSQVDTFISTICGKFVVKLLRISSILTALEEAFNYVMDLDETLEIDKFNLSENLKLHFEKVFLKKNCCYIKKETVQRANKLLDISNTTKILFAGYIVDDVSLSFDKILTCLYESLTKKGGSEKSNVYAKIIKTPGPVIVLNDIIQRFKLKKAHVLELFNDLVKFGIGSIEKSESNSNGKQNTFFVKANEILVKENPNISRIILNFGLSIEEYLECLDEQPKSNDNLKKKTASKKISELNENKTLEDEEDENSKNSRNELFSQKTFHDSNFSNSFTIEEIPCSQPSKAKCLSEDDDILEKDNISYSFSQKFQNSKRAANRTSWYKDSTQEPKSFKKTDDNSESN